MYVRITFGKCDHILRAAAAELINGLVVVADHTDIRARFADLPDQLLLQIVDILILVDHQIADPAQIVLYCRVFFRLAQRLIEQKRIVQISVAVQTRSVLFKCFALLPRPCIRVAGICDHLLDT